MKFRDELKYPNDEVQNEKLLDGVENIRVIPYLCLMTQVENNRLSLT